MAKLIDTLKETIIACLIILGFILIAVLMFIVAPVILLKYWYITLILALVVGTFLYLRNPKSSIITLKDISRRSLIFIKDICVLIVVIIVIGTIIEFGLYLYDSSFQFLLSYCADITGLNKGDIAWIVVSIIVISTLTKGIFDYRFEKTIVHNKIKSEKNGER